MGLQTFENWGAEADKYSGDTDDASLSSVAYEGLDGLRVEGSNRLIYRAGLDLQDSGVSIWINHDDSDAVYGGIAFGVQDPDNYYFLTISAQNDELGLYVFDNGSVSQLSFSNVSLSGGVWHRLRLTQFTNADISGVVEDASGTQLSSFSVSDSTHNSGGIGFGTLNADFASSYVVFDNFEWPILEAPTQTLALDSRPSFISSDAWLVDGVPAKTLQSETRTHRSLSLALRVGEATRSAVLAPLRETAEKLDTLIAADGSFRTLDRAPTDGVYTLTPPPDRDPPREQRDYLVADYAERPLDQQSVSHAVEVEFRAGANREPDGSATDETRASDEWAVDFRSAQIATKRVKYQRQSGTETAANTETLTLILTPTQTKILEESATRSGAVSVREVPDGPNSYDDDSASPTDANTVTVTTPDGTDPMPDGDYVVVDWETEWLSAAAYRVQLTLGHP